MIDSSQQLTTNSQRGVLARLGDQLRQYLCGLHGHDDLLHFEKGRMSLHCVSCGYQSPGWEVKHAPRATSTADTAPRPRIVRMPLVGERRVA